MGPIEPPENLLAIILALLVLEKEVIIYLLFDKIGINQSPDPDNPFASHNIFLTD